MLDIGGEIFLVILFLAAMLWALVIERIYYLWVDGPMYILSETSQWLGREDRKSWYAQKFRERILLNIRWQINARLSLIRILIIICPLLGLLGTVLGMLEVFDGMAVSGSNNAKSTAAGVSKATVSTMAGMVVAISGLLVSIIIERRAKHEKLRAEQQLTLN